MYNNTLYYAAGFKLKSLNPDNSSQQRLIVGGGNNVNYFY